MATEKLPTEKADEAISQQEFVERDQALTEALDKLEKDIHPPKTKPEPIGGMF
jgi:hypothetical protein